MIKLVHGQDIKIPSWDSMTYANFSTLRGYLQNIHQSEVEKLMKSALENGNDEAWCVYPGTAISSSPDYYNRLLVKAKAAILINHDELVDIEGKIFKVNVLSGCHKRPIYSDPIKFIRQ